MVYIQKNVPPPNRVLTFTMNNFVGGLNNRSSIVQENQAQDLINMKFEDETVMVKRDGVEYYDGQALSTSVTYIDEFKPYNDVSQLIRASNTEVYAGSTKIADVAGKVNGRNYLGYYYFVDGAKIRVYGKFPQTTDTYTKVIGTATNTYRTFELANPPSGYTPLPTSHVQGVWAYDYTNNKCWYEPCENEVADTYKGANVLPVNPKYIEIRAERLYLAGSATDNDNVFITDIGNGFYFPVYLPIQLPPNSDQITGLVTFHDTVVVGRKNDIHVIYGNTNRTDLNTAMFQLKQVSTHTGFASQDAVDLVNNFLFFLGSDGNVYAMNTTKTDVDLLSTQIINTHIDIFKAPISVTTNDLATASSIFFKDEWLLAIGDKVLVYSYRHRAFTLYKYSNVNMKCFYVKDYVLLYGSNTGRVLKNSATYSDLGAPYQAFWKSRLLDMDEPTTYKQFREFYLVAHTFENFSSNIDLKFEIDHVDVDESYGLLNEASVWGKTKFGGRFINRNIVASLPIVLGRRGRTFRFTFSNGHFAQPSVANYADLTSYPGLKEGFLVYVTNDSKYYLFQDSVWTEQSNEALFQPMRVYEVSGQYELRGKR